MGEERFDKNVFAGERLMVISGIWKSAPWGFPH